MADLDPDDDPWGSILFKLQHGIRIEQQEVYDALASAYPVNDRAKPFLLAVVSGEYKFRRGRKSRFSEPALAGDVLGHLVDLAQSEILDHSINLSGWGAEAAQLVREARTKVDSGLVGAPTAREAAKDVVASIYGISVRALEGLISKGRRRIEK